MLFLNQITLLLLDIPTKYQIIHLLQFVANHWFLTIFSQFHGGFNHIYQFFLVKLKLPNVNTRYLHKLDHLVESLR